jgi:hypothetical protein
MKNLKFLQALKFLIPVLALLALLIFSCQKNEKAKPSTESEEPVVVRSAEKYGYVLQVNASLYTLENDTDNETDKTKWAASMALGEKVVIGKPRRATFAGDGKVYDFMEVRRDTGGAGLAFTSRIAESGSLAVVTDEKAILYKSAKTIDATSTILPRKTVVVWFPDTQNSGFAEIRAYDPEALVPRQSFIRTSSISRDEADIQSSILLQTALPLKKEGPDKIRRDALLESALMDYPNSAFRADIEEMMGLNTKALIKTEPAARRFMSVNNDDVDVHDLPDPVAGKVIGQLNMDDEVTIGEQTAATYTVGGQSARWYHITAPLYGWVFGGFLE